MRFVRNLLYSLFGKRGLTEDDFQKLFDRDGIYWTSFHKCYDKNMLRKKDGKYAMDKFTHTRCGEKFLQKEIDALNPELLIVMGKATCNAIHKMVNERKLRLPPNYFFTDYFYKEQDQNKIEKIRESLAKVLNLNIYIEPFDTTIMKTTKTNAEVHYQFQLCAAQALRLAQGGSSDSLPSPQYENEVERLWIEQVTIPIIRRYHILLNYWSSIESSLLSFICKANERQTEINTLQPAESNITGKNEILLEKMSILSDHLIEKADAHFYSLKGRRNQLFLEWRKLKSRLKVIRTVRNAIIHSSGFIPYRTVFHKFKVKNYKLNFDINTELLSNCFSGIMVIPNIVYVKDQGVDEMDALYQQLTNFLIKADIN